MKLTASQRQGHRTRRPKPPAHRLRGLRARPRSSRGASSICSRRADRTRSLPRNIIAFTFTDKAAAELKERIVTRTREALGDVPGMAEMFVGTIHAFCLELLKTEVAEVPEVRGAERGAAGAVRRSEQHARAGSPRRTDLSGHAAEALQGHAALRRGAVDPARSRNAMTPQLEGCSRARRPRRPTRALLDDKSYLDYSSILEEAVTVLDERRRRCARASPSGSSTSSWTSTRT